MKYYRAVAEASYMRIWGAGKEGGVEVTAMAAILSWLFHNQKQLMEVTSMQCYPIPPVEKPRTTMYCVCCCV